MLTQMLNQLPEEEESFLFLRTDVYKSLCKAGRGIGRGRLAPNRTVGKAAPSATVEGVSSSPLSPSYHGGYNAGDGHFRSRRLCE